MVVDKVGFCDFVNKPPRSGVGAGRLSRPSAALQTPSSGFVISLKLLNLVQALFPFRDEQWGDCSAPMRYVCVIHTKDYIMRALTRYGARESDFAEAAEYPDLELARVTAQYKGLYTLTTGTDERLAEVSGKFRHEEAAPARFPAVGDFVMARLAETGAGHAVIHRVLRRRSAVGRAAFSRRQLRYLLSRAKGAVFVAACADRVLGYVSLLASARHGQGRIYSLAVEPGSRGQGLAERLADAALDWALAHGLTSVFLGKH